MDTEIQQFHSARTFTDNKGPINSLDFHRTEDLLVTAGDDDSIHVYNTANGTQQRTLLSKKYGVGCICFTHHTNAIICGSKNNSWDETLRYLSLHDNRYLRYFKGHRAGVVAVCMSPKSDAFLSASKDNTVRLWDLRSNACQGLLQVQCSLQPAAAYDQQGLVFAVATEDGVLKLYDMKQYERGPFATFPAHPDPVNRAPYTSLQFSYDGRSIMATSPGKIVTIDAYKGEHVHTHNLPEGPAGAYNFNVTCSPDDEYVLSGAPDSTVKVWSSKSMRQVACWGGLSGVPTCVKWAPRRKLVAVADTQGVLGLWVPRR